MITHSLKNQKLAILGKEGKTGQSLSRAFAHLNLQESHPSEADIIITSPGIPPSQYGELIFGNAKTTNHKTRTTTVISDVEFVYRWLHEHNQLPKIVAVTGTNGKSTVTAMIAHLLECPAMGNIGIPVAELLCADTVPDTLVLELSSYQLANCTQFTPIVSVILNITPDHLLWHGDMAHYIQSKAKITTQQHPEHHLIYNAEDTACNQIAAQSQATKHPITPDNPLYAQLSQFPLFGAHNHFNAVVSLTAAQCITDTMPMLLEKINTFKSLPHRLEPAGQTDRFLFINDSKATNPESVLIALRAFPNRILYLLLGGQDKHIDYPPYLPEILTRSTRIATYGEIGAQLYADIQHTDPQFPATTHPTLPEAITELMKHPTHSTPIPIILLSPGTASFDQFKNFEDRGDFFKKWVKDHILKKPKTVS